MSPPDVFASSLPLIERLLASVCRRNAFPPDESEEFASWAKLRLIDDDYAVLRKFRGDASLPTYLTTVIVNLFRDYRIHRWGKWRPSAEAKRLGEVAVQLETLLVRDGRTLTEAIGLLRTNFQVAQSAADLTALAGRLPPRLPRRFESDEVLESFSGGASADSGLVERERSEAAARAAERLGEAIAELGSEERLLLRLRFQEGLAVVEIARILGAPAKPLYGRLERTLGALRRTLEKRGLGAGEIRELVADGGLELTIDFRAGGELSAADPSNEKERSA
ncbi:MAG: RNA polymerase sigma factor [Candidatus Binatia bacterium]